MRKKTRTKQGEKYASAGVKRGYLKGGGDFFVGCLGLWGGGKIVATRGEERTGTCRSEQREGECVAYERQTPGIQGSRGGRLENQSPTITKVIPIHWRNSLFTLWDIIHIIKKGRRKEGPQRGEKVTLKCYLS